MKELENFIPVARLFGKEGESQIIYAANEVSVKKAINCIGKDVLKKKKKKKNKAPKYFKYPPSYINREAFT